MMFRLENLEKLSVTYKYTFTKDIILPDGNTCNHWIGEKYKWEGYKLFQDNWDIDASDFTNMFKRSFKKMKKSLDRGVENSFKGITELVNAAPERVRELFANLYDESINIITRYKTFTYDANLLYNDVLHKDIGRNKQSNHSVSVYLSIKYPEKYFIYSQDDINALGEYLGCTRTCGNMATDKTYNFYNEFYHQVRMKLKEDNELLYILHNIIDDTMYQDPELTLLTTDLAYFVKCYINTLKILNCI